MAELASRIRRRLFRRRRGIEVRYLAVHDGHTLNLLLDDPWIGTEVCIGDGAEIRSLGRCVRVIGGSGLVADLADTLPSEGTYQILVRKPGDRLVPLFAAGEPLPSGQAADDPAVDGPMDTHSKMQFLITPTRNGPVGLKALMPAYPPRILAMWPEPAGYLASVGGVEIGTRLLLRERTSKRTKVVGVVSAERTAQLSLNDISVSDSGEAEYWDLCVDAPDSTRMRASVPDLRIPGAAVRYPALFGYEGERVERRKPYITSGGYIAIKVSVAEKIEEK